MALPHISVEDCFPIVRQTILDTYKIDSFLMNYPYSDLERLDMGLRKMVWGTYSTNSAIFSLSPEQDAWQIIILKSVLGFYNLIITVTNEEHPTMFGFMPFSRMMRLITGGVAGSVCSNSITRCPLWKCRA